MGKTSPFQALIKPIDEETSPTGLSQADTVAPKSVTHSPDHVSSQPSLPSRGKSSRHEFRRLTVYTRRETVMALKRLQLETGKDVSDLVQEALDVWLGKDKAADS